MSGFHTSQRLKALADGYPLYLALHTIDGLDVLTGEDYRQKGGGNFARWQQHITDWHRNLYDGLDRAPAVGADEVLVVSATGPQSLIELGLAPSAMQAVELEKLPAQRWLAKMDRVRLSAIDRLPDDMRIVPVGTLGETVSAIETAAEGGEPAGLERCSAE